MTGIKYDDGKPRPDLVMGDLMPAILQMIFVGSFGAYKYAPSNFLKLEDAEKRFADAAGRHYAKRKMGEIFDDETGEYHLAHEIWDKCAELLFYIKEHEDIDYVLSIRRESDDLFFDGDNWGELPYWFDEEPGRQVIWKFMSEGVTDIKVNKIPMGECQDIWGRCDEETECRIEEALKAVCDPILDARSDGWMLRYALFDEVDLYRTDHGTWGSKETGSCLKFPTCEAAQNYATENFIACRDYQLQFFPFDPRATAAEAAEGLTKLSEALRGEKFGIYNPVIDSWLKWEKNMPDSWTRDPKEARTFQYRSDAVVKIRDGMSIIDAQVCDIRPIELSTKDEVDQFFNTLDEITEPVPSQAWGIWDVNRCMWLEVIAAHGLQESWTNQEQEAIRFSKDAATNVLAAKPFSEARNLKMRKLQ